MTTVVVNGNYLTPRTQSGTSVAYSAVAGLTGAVSGSVIDVVCTTDAYVAIGDGATATANGYFVAKNVTYRFGCTPGHTVSAIQDSSAGSLKVHEMVPATAP